MKVVIIADSFLPHISGVTTHCVELAYGLINKGNEVLIFAPESQKKVKIPKKLKSAKIVFLPSIPSLVAPTLRICIPHPLKVFFEIRKFRPDIIETSSPSPLGIDILMTSKILNIPCISVFHTLLTSKEYLRSIFKTKSTSKLEKISWKYHRWFYNSSDAVFIATKKTAKILVRHGIREEKIIFSPILTDLSHTVILPKDRSSDLKRKYKLLKNVAVFMGRISFEKRLDYLLLIWSKVVESRQKCSLLIIGSGPDESRIKRMVKELNLQDNVVMAGAMEHEKLMSSGILSACDLFISTSTSETFGLSGLEAMSHKIPVVLARSQGLSELVQKAGFVCPKNNLICFKKSIIKIFDSPYLKSKLGSEAKKIAASFGSEGAINKILKNYKVVRRAHTKKPAIMSTPFF